MPPPTTQKQPSHRLEEGTTTKTMALIHKKSTAAVAKQQQNHLQRRLQQHQQQHQNSRPVGVTQLGANNHINKRGDNNNDNNNNKRDNVIADPYNFVQRFVEKQAVVYETALHEIVELGYNKESSGWMRFVMPSAPFVVDGVEQGSQMNRKYALRSDEEVSAYLNFPTTNNGINLRQNYVEMVRALRRRLLVDPKQNMLEEIFGPVDAPKAVSSLRLFKRVASANGDKELSRLCRAVLDLANDPYQFVSRFVENQASVYAAAIREIEQYGYKRSCWMWFVLPSAPYVVDGVERGSNMNRKYSLRSDEEVKAYLTFPTTFGVNLRNNYVRMVRAVRRCLQTTNTTVEEIFGSIDAPKAVSSFRLFERVASASKTNDEELYQHCHAVLGLINKDGGKNGNRGKEKGTLRGLLWRSKSS